MPLIFPDTPDSAGALRAISADLADDKWVFAGLKKERKQE